MIKNSIRLLLTLLGLDIDFVDTGISVKRSDVDISPASLLQFIYSTLDYTNGQITVNYSLSLIKPLLRITQPI